ncbi:hypothetical protein O181_027855 [Austropuccinia psidii MF-1]|uniref:Integrase catalytic domain-containing protein n=1 Tax=Austropuccinia psidii MF-1 TaxID=1389203 RepID=A0A9Q3H3L2_9BASI|nr:hypothetical protein [Austropuccinia psidii MF-1]
MDFITHLPLSNNFDSILVVVDRFSKMAIFIPAYVTITALELAQIFISQVFSKHGLQVSSVGARGYLFVSSFWTNSCQQLKISRDLSTSFHPETDRQRERVNQILKLYLWMYVSYHQDDWHTCLPLSVTIKMTGTPASLWLNLPTIKQNIHQQRNPLFSPLMEEIPVLNQLVFLKTHLLESYKQNSNQYSKL